MHLRTETARDCALDNIRGLLIFSVVFAHLLEVCTPFPGYRTVYQFIYTFHMPVFLFLFGYHVRYSPKRIVYRWCIPYIIFQSIYILFARLVLKASISFQFTTPYWLLWYMIACLFYQLLLPLFDTEERPRQILSLLCAFSISLLIGFENSVGYYLSLSRFFVFQPWFLLGYYCKKNEFLKMVSGHPKVMFSILFGSTMMIGLSIVFLLFAGVPNGLLYGSYSYSNCGSTVWMRTFVSLISLSWILFLFVGLKPYWNRKVILLTQIGQNTWPIFLLHGFIVKSVPIYFPYLVSSPWRVILLSCAILVLLGNNVMNKLIYYISFSWLEKTSAK